MLSIFIVFISGAITYMVYKRSEEPWKKYLPSIFLFVSSIYWGVGPQFFDYFTEYTVSFIGLVLGVLSIVGFISTLATLSIISLKR